VAPVALPLNSCECESPMLLLMTWNVYTFSLLTDKNIRSMFSVDYFHYEPFL